LAVSLPLLRGKPDLFLSLWTWVELLMEFGAIEAEKKGLASLWGWTRQMGQELKNVFS
jgi:hypothetical protein